MKYTAPTDLLANKTILVTGAGDGIGRRAAITFAQHGACVILLGRTVKKLEAVYDEIINAGFVEPAIVPMDLKGATKKNYVDMAATIVDQFGQLDGVLHNAAALGVLSPLEHISENSWNEVMHTNVTAPFLMTQALIQVLKQAPNASVVFTSSGVATGGHAFWGPYAVSKHACQGLMATIADEYEKSSIRFNSVNPGAVNTGMRAKAFPGEDKSKLVTPQDLMPTYLYLMGDDSVELSGQTLQAQ
ncbi:MAG: NAD(P)-dependent dehydrogenase (short-subunit alcohol dehydrogenase family) [Phenylobacterium sp.]|jgi:NAD(P)-dependent dehydrogenase (short-subunit alcohol dehydrogenase family)